MKASIPKFPFWSSPSLKSLCPPPRSVKHEEDGLVCESGSARATGTEVASALLSGIAFRHRIPIFVVPSSSLHLVFYKRKN
jgi:hypothetical protein